MTICGSLLIGRGIIKLVFGELWPMESQVKLYYSYTRNNKIMTNGYISICMIVC